MLGGVIFRTRRNITHESDGRKDDICILILHTFGQQLTVLNELIVRTVGEILFLRTDTTEQRSDRYLRDVKRSRHILLRNTVTVDDRGRSRQITFAVQLDLQSR